MTRLTWARRSRSPWVVAAGAVAIGGCESEAPDGTETPDGEVPIGVVVRDARPLPSANIVTCRTQTCEAAEPSGIGTEPCCTDAGACGLQSRITGPACLEPGQPGSPSLACPPIDVPGGPQLQGCCSPEGRCGIFDRFGGLGCIPGELLGREPAICDPRSAAAACSQIVEVLCDGAEDCPGAQICCGRVSEGLYDAFGCFDDCESIVDGQSGIWLPLCHPGERCDDPTRKCTGSSALPPPLARCYSSGLDAGAASPAEPGIACGMGQCQVGDKCCLRPPHPPYCTPFGTACACEPQADADASRSDAAALSVLRDAATPPDASDSGYADASL